MRKLTVTKALILSEEMTLEMLCEFAIGALHCTQAACDKYASQSLKNASPDVAKLSYAKLRTVILTKLGGDACEHGAFFAAGELVWEFQCLADAEYDPEVELDMSAAGANTKKAGARRTSKLSGAYEVVKMRDMSGDEGKQAIWQWIWTCDTFEDFFAKAPAKSFTSKTNRQISAASEIGWALKSGWIRQV